MATEAAEPSTASREPVTRSSLPLAPRVQLATPHSSRPVQQIIEVQTLDSKSHITVRKEQSQRQTDMKGYDLEMHLQKNCPLVSSLLQLNKKSKTLLF